MVLEWTRYGPSDKGSSQDQYCSQALARRWKVLGKFLQREALVDVLRGRVKVI